MKYTDHNGHIVTSEQLRGGNVCWKCGKPLDPIYNRDGYDSDEECRDDGLDPNEVVGWACLGCSGKKV